MFSMFITVPNRTSTAIEELKVDALNTADTVMVELLEKGHNIYDTTKHYLIDNGYFKDGIPC